MPIPNLRENLASMPDAVIKATKKGLPRMAALMTPALFLASCERVPSQQLYILSVNLDNISNTPYADLGKGVEDFADQYKNQAGKTLLLGQQPVVLGVSGQTEFLTTSILSAEGEVTYYKIATYKDAAGQIQNRALIGLSGTVKDNNNNNVDYVSYYPLSPEKTSQLLAGQQVSIDTSTESKDLGTAFYGLTLKPGLKKADFQAQLKNATPEKAREILTKNLSTFFITNPNTGKSFIASIDDSNTLDQLVGLLTGAQPAFAASESQITLTSPVGTKTPAPSPTLTEIPTPPATATAKPTEVPLPSEFLTQFDGTAYSFKNNQVLFSPGGANQVVIASIESGQFVFTVNGKEVSVGPKLATVPEAKWFLNGASDQVMAVYDETGTYWQYQFDFTTNKWVEKSLPQEVSTNVNNPTKIEWNDIISNRWATAVRRDIDSGKIQTFNDKVVVNSVEFNNFYYEKHGIASLTFSDAEHIYAANSEIRPIKYTDGFAAFGEIMLGGQSGLVVTEQIANKSSSFTLLSLVAPSKNEFLLKFFFDPYEIKHRALVPIVKVKSPEHLIHYWNIDYGDYYTWFAENDSGFIQAAYDEWLASGDMPQVLEKVLFTASGVTW